MQQHAEKLAQETTERLRLSEQEAAQQAASQHRESARKAPPEASIPQGAGQSVLSRIPQVVRQFNSGGEAHTQQYQPECESMHKP